MPHGLKGVQWWHYHTFFLPPMSAHRRGLAKLEAAIHALDLEHRLIANVGERSPVLLFRRSCTLYLAAIEIYSKCSALGWPYPVLGIE